VPLPFPVPADVVSAGDRVFVSGGRESTEVAVADAAGAVTGSLSGLPGPTDLLLSNDRRTLYVALPTANAIAAFDTGSLVESARYPTGDAECPSSLALTGRFLWFGYGCDQWGGGIGRVDLGRQPAVVTAPAVEDDFYDAPLVASAARNNKVLLVGQPALSPGTIYGYSIGTGGALTLLRANEHGSIGSNLRDIALDPTGTTAFTASGAPYEVLSVAFADMTTFGPTYHTDPYPSAVELTRDGTRLAGGADATYAPDVFVFNVDGTAVASFELGQTLVPGALAWAPNGRRLYAASEGPWWEEPRSPGLLHVLPVPAA
jgi:hypothetical protein